MGDCTADATLEAVGYEPKFKRVLSRRDLILYGLAILTPTAAYPVCGVIQKVSHGQAAASYLVALFAMVLTAASYAKMAAAFPAAGSTYTYAQRALDERIGFLAGWAMILDYMLFPLLSVIYAALTAERFVPQIPYLVWALMFAAAITLVNIRGIQVTTRASSVMLVVMTASVALFVCLAARRVVASAGWMALWSRSGFFETRSIHLGPLLAGAAIATFSYIGFDAITTLAEDTLHPERDIAFSTVLVCVAQGVFCVVIVFLAALVWPNYHSFPRVETAILDISRLIGGAWMVAAITFVLLVAGLACALTGQAGASRLLFGMARDGAMSKRVFGYLDPKHSTPVRSIYAMGVITVVGTILIRFELAVELLNFGALVGFILVNLSVIRHYYSRKRLRSGWHFMSNLIFPLLGAFVCSYLWLSLSNAAKLVGFCWLGAGTIYLAVLTRGFRQRPLSLHI